MKIRSKRHCGLFCLILGSMLIPLHAEAELENQTERRAMEKQSTWDYLKGQPTDDRLLLGMFTLHTNPSSFKRRNWSQKLFGLQINDFFVGTFENSFYRRSWVVGVARNLSNQRVHPDWETSFGYRLGFIYGYNPKEAPLSDYTPVIPMIGIYKQYVYRERCGIEFVLTSVASVSFFYQF